MTYTEYQKLKTYYCDTIPKNKEAKKMNEIIISFPNNDKIILNDKGNTYIGELGNKFAILAAKNNLDNFWLLDVLLKARKTTSVNFDLIVNYCNTCDNTGQVEMPYNEIWRCPVCGDFYELFNKYDIVLE